MEAPALERTFRGHKAAVASVSFHPLHAQQLASGGADGVVMVWNFRPQLRAFRFAGHGGAVLDVRFSPQGELLASASQDRTVRLWTPSVRGESVVLKAHAGAVRSVSFSACGRSLLTASDDRSVKVWALPTRRFQCSLSGHSNWVRCARFSADASRVASASDDKTVKLWDTEKRVCVQTFYEHAGVVNCVQFHPRDAGSGGSVLASGSFDRSVNVWDARAGRLVQHYKAHDASVSSVHFHPSGHYLVSASLDSTLKIWDVREGQLLYTLHGHDGAVASAEFSHDGALLASGSSDSVVMVWQAELDRYLRADAHTVVPATAANGVAARKPARISTASASMSASASPVAGTSSSGRPKTPLREDGSALLSMSPPPTPVPAPAPTQKPQHPSATASLYELRTSSESGVSPKATSAAPAARAESAGAVNGGRAGTHTEAAPLAASGTAATLQHIVGQLEIITRTLTVLEERISLNEDRIADVTRMQKELLQRQRQQQPARRPFEQFDARLLLRHVARRVESSSRRMSAWEEAFDGASQRLYYFNRSTGETSWTPPGAPTSEAADNDSASSSASSWRQAFDEASQTVYYYNVLTGDTAWTLPEEPQEPDADLSYLAFAVVRLQSVFRGARDRRRVARLVKAQFRITRDPETAQTLYTNLAANTSSWRKPALFATLGISDRESDDDDDADFDAFRMEAEENDGDTGDDDDLDDNNCDEGGSDVDGGGKARKKRQLPRSKAQERVDEAEDAGADGTELDLSALDAWKLSSRIWNLQHLKKLAVPKNQLARIPSGIQDLVRLEELDVSFNLLTRLPSCLQTTTTLTALNASNNRIQSFSPKLWKLRALRRLDLSHNRLAELPYVEGDLKLLRETREWQVGIGLLTELRSLMLNHNMLSALPKSIARCAALEFLNLSNNNIGALSDEIGDLESLQCLYLHKNALAALPDSVGSLRRLEILEAKENRLTSIPETVGDMQSLQQLGLSSNQLTHLPEELGALHRLSRFDLDHNPNLVTLDVLFRRLPAIRVFSANACGLVRFETLAFLTDSPVRALQLSQNALLDFPVIFAKSVMQHTLEELVLRRNNLVEFPVEVARFCVELRSIDVSSNKLRSLPPEIRHLVNLEVLHLSQNELEMLPDELTLLAQLRELKCDHNRLRALPLAIGRLVLLAHVDVSFNQLETLPTSMTKLAALESVHANDNQLQLRPPALHRTPSCFCDFSNNPFTDEHQRAVAHRETLARAAQFMADQRFEAADALFSAAIDTLSDQPHDDQRKQRPQLHYARGVCRLMLLKMLRDTIADASATLDSCEHEWREKTLLHTRSAIRQQKQLEKEKQRSQQLEGDDTGANADAITASKSLFVVAANALRSASPVSESPEEADVNDNSDREGDAAQSEMTSFAAAAATREAARARQLEFGEGAVADFEVAIRLETAELPTAYYSKGLAHMALLQLEKAILSFTDALVLLVPRPEAGSSVDTKFLAFRDRANFLLSAPVPRAAIHVFLRRAEAYRALGQLPSALMDVRHVLAHHPVDTVTPALEARERAYAAEWEAQQTEYFVDHVSLFRAFDVAARSGLPRRPEVVDVHRCMTAPEVKKRREVAAPEKLLRPAERFTAEAGRLAAEIRAADASALASVDETIATRQKLLARTRDFRREIRENLQLEVEEARQRAVEKQLARLAQLEREERERELREQLFMKYEDELTQWLAAEARRLESERLRLETEAQRRADAKAAYATRLARRGGRRQQAPAAASQRKSPPSRKPPSIT